MARFQFRCVGCGRVFPEDPELMLCPDCSSSAASPSLRGVLEVEILDPPSRLPALPASSPAVLEAFLPIGRAELLSPLAVGGTPLLPVPGLRRALDMPRLLLKDDTRNPSGSTKDRASLLVAAKALEYGKTTIATASTGNAATALAAICAAGSQRAIVFVPADAPQAKLTQMQSYGARIFAVRGSYDEAFELCNEACRVFGFYNRNTALNPFTAEGKKTVALEIAAQLDGKTPDVVIVPAGDGVITAGIAKGFLEMRNWGLISTLPRMLIVQPEGSSALVRALERGAEDIEVQHGASSVADSLVVEAPRNAFWALRLIRATGGAGVRVSEEEILAAIPELAASTGVFAEPAAAASLAGLKKALEAGLISRSESCVMVVTGTGLKDPEAARRSLPPLEGIEPGPAGIEELSRSLRLLES